MPRRVVTALALAGAAWGLTTAAAASTAHAWVVPPAKADHLRITVQGTGDPERDGTYGLMCHPAGGSHPEPAAACEALDAAAARAGRGAPGARPGPFAPVPAGEPCTMIYGGPATARITGVWHGRPVNARFDRSDGCEMARWDRLVPALPAAGESVPVSNTARP